MNSVEGENAK